jgi:predicted ATP-dependent endonuclease of OLD family
MEYNMKLEKLEIEGLRKIKNATINFSDATFIIGPNNVGKSTIFKAIEFMLRNITPSKEDYTMRYDETSNTNIVIAEELRLTATFSNIPDESSSWQGFRGRIFIEEDERKIRYRKTFSLTGVKYELYQQEKHLDPKYFEGSKITIKSIINGGLQEESVREYFEKIDDTQNLNVKAHLSLLESFYDVWEFEDSYNWIENPGGIPQLVMSKLPKLIIIPAEHKSEEIDSNRNSALGEVMNTIFSDIIERSENYGKVREYFSELAKEIDTSREETEFGKLMIEVNKTIKNVFPDSQILARVNLSDPNTFLKPNYEIQLGSNILTDVSLQGTGMIRATAFSLLRFREDWRRKRDNDLRNLIICFEEPELFLHPNAANQMRDTIYELTNDENQIICTSHSPYMIDLSREKENQIINNLSLVDETFVGSFPFNVTKEFRNLLDNEKTYVKLLLKIDDYISRVFFCKRVIIVEGDTEDILFRKTVELLPKEKRINILANIQVIKARGKATIAPLVKYLYALGISDIYVIHDKDTGKDKAEQFNDFILSALHGDESKRSVLENCVEDVLGYPVPSKDKPYKAFEFIDSWKTYSDITKKWQEIIEKAFGNYLA